MNRTVRPAIIVHGGAGGVRDKKDAPRYLEEIGNALRTGLRTLRTGSSLDAVMEAVEYMEESGVFNAGRGSGLTNDGRIQLDAAVMSGKGLRAGAVGACDCTYRASRLARAVMERTNHVLIVGDDCKQLAVEAGLGLERLRPTEAVLRRYKAESIHARDESRHGTVGAVAIDHSAVPAAAVSTGGLWLKKPGRVGDSAVIGAGIYADESLGAACATGIGEEIMRNVLAWEACMTMRRGTAKLAARRAIDLITRRSGKDTAGIITVDGFGRIGFAHNTPTMGTGWFDTVREKIIVELK